MICPICGSFISPGDVYCPSCGATFRLDEEEDDYPDRCSVSKSGGNEYGSDSSFKQISQLKLIMNQLIEVGEYESALNELVRMKEYCDVSEELKSVRRHYVGRYVEYIKERKYSDAHVCVFEYLGTYPDDSTFLSLISVNARQFGDSSMLNEMKHRMDMMGGYEDFEDVDYDCY